MNRRDFLKVAAAVVAARALPIPALPVEAPAGEWISLDVLRRTVQTLQNNRAFIMNDGWMAIVHPDIERDLIEITARQQWKAAYRQARMELKKMASDMMAQGEFGIIEDVRFIESA